MEKNDPEISEAELRELGRVARVELARRAAKTKDILSWGKYLFPEKFNLKFCQELHGYLVSIREERLTATEAPRNHAKTTIKCFLIPLFQALEEPKKFRHYISVQSTEKKALSINKSIKHELELNQELFDLYGDMVSDVWAEGQFVLKNGVVFTAVGAGQSIRGINYNNIRPDYINVDDLYDDEDIHNPESTRKKNEWFWSTLYPCRSKSKQNSVHIQGTAINAEDLLAEMKDKPGVAFRTFKTVLDWDKKILLWPELMTWADLLAERDVTPETIWVREFQNERTSSSTSFIKMNWLYPPGGKSWEYDPDEIIFDERFRVVEIMLCCDPSIGEKEQNDFTGLALVMKAAYNDGDGYVYFIVALAEEHLSLDERVKRVQVFGKMEVPVRVTVGEKTETQNRKVNRALIEAIAGFKDFAGEVKRRVNLAVTMIDHVKDKISNLENKSKHFQNSRVFINKRIEKRLRDTAAHQLTTNYPKHDDVRDAILLAMNEQTGPSIRVFSNA